MRRVAVQFFLATGHLRRGEPIANQFEASVEGAGEPSRIYLDAVAAPEVCLAAKGRKTSDFKDACACSAAGACPWRRASTTPQRAQRLNPLASKGVTVESSPCALHCASGARDPSPGPSCLPVRTSGLLHLAGAVSALCTGRLLQMRQRATPPSAVYAGELTAYAERAAPL